MNKVKILEYVYVSSNYSGEFEVSQIIEVKNKEIKRYA